MLSTPGRYAPVRRSERDFGATRHRASRPRSAVRHFEVGRARTRREYRRRGWSRAERAGPRRPLIFDRHFLIDAVVALALSCLALVTVCLLR